MKSGTPTFLSPERRKRDVLCLREGFPKPADHVFLAQLTIQKIFFHQLIVALGGGFAKLQPGRFHSFLVLGGNLGSRFLLIA